MHKTWKVIPYTNWTLNRTHKIKKNNRKLKKKKAENEKTNSVFSMPTHVISIFSVCICDPNPQSVFSFFLFRFILCSMRHDVKHWTTLNMLIIYICMYYVETYCVHISTSCSFILDAFTIFSTAAVRFSFCFCFSEIFSECVCDCISVSCRYSVISFHSIESNVKTIINRPANRYVFILMPFRLLYTQFWTLW